PGAPASEASDPHRADSDYRPDRHARVEPLDQQLLNRFSCPHHKRQTQLVWTVTRDHLHGLSRFRRSQPRLPWPSPTARFQDTRPLPLPKAHPPVDRSSGDTEQPARLGLAHALANGFHHALTQSLLPHSRERTRIS